MSADTQNDLKWRRSFMLGACVVLVLFVLTAGLSMSIRSVDTASSHTADVRRELPESVGDWKGERIYYCQSELCMRSFSESELAGSHTCPECGGRLDQVSLGERNILPPDTIISRRLYQNQKNENVTVTVVISGSERRSIHRPQQCLPAQGYAIERSSVLAIPMVNHLPLQVMLIRAQKRSATMFMVYWFAGGGHETQDHFKRMFYIAWDNLFHNVRPRWAYVSLQTVSNTGDSVAEKRLAKFVRELYPLLKPEVPLHQQASLPE